MASRVGQSAIMDPNLRHCTHSVPKHLAAYSAADQVLCINELLDLTFSFMSSGCKTTNARVCKKWCDIALDSVWRKVTDVTDLLEILAPLTTSGYKVFRRLPEPQDWTRFEKYGRRVRELCFKDHVFGRESSFRNVFNVLGNYRPTLHLLPNLHTLHWIGSSIHSITQNSIIFMHDRVERFSLTIPPSAQEHDDLAPFFRTVVFRMPRITHLILKRHVTHVVEDHLIELLHGLSHLTHITFPNCHLPSRIVEEVSRMSHLVEVDIDDGDEFAFECEDGTEVFSPSLVEGAFPVLRSLSIRAHLGDAAEFMKSNFAPHAITKLHIASRQPSPETSFVLQAFLSVLACTCHNLEDLDLNFVLSTTELPDDTSTAPVITFDALCGIFKPILTSFMITHPYAVAMTLDNINDIARSCPLLVKFVLNCAPPVIDRDHGLSLTALVPFAHHCPNMKILGFFFGASTSNFLMAEENFEPFKNSIVLSVGISDLEEDVGPATQFLLKICPLGCEIDASEKWPGQFGEQLRSRGEIGELIELRKARWSKVQCTLPLLSRRRKKDKENTQRLEAKIKAMGEQLEAAIRGQKREQHDSRV